MSTVSVSNLKNAASATNNLVLAADGSVSIVGGAVSPYTGMRNRIINGAMTIDQRNNGASVTPTTANPYTLDRWRTVLSQNSKFTLQQNAGAVTPPAGFTKYLGITSSSAYSITSGDFFFVQQQIEGFNTADLGWGTASAQSVTLSFWVRSSLTGTFGGSLQNAGFNRSYPFTYTIASANTWEYKTVTVAGDTSGTWATDNTAGIKLQMGFGVGSTYSGTAGSWASAEYYSATGATSVVGTSGATFFLTGVQFEKGSVATPFEFRSIGQEFGLAQRYYWRSGNGGLFSTLGSSVVVGSSTVNGFSVKTPVTMRASPTSTISNLRVYDGGTPVSVTSIAATWSSTDCVGLDLNTGSGLTTGRNAVVQYNNSSTAYVDASSEL